ncbi:MAG: hypothetical protein CVU59_13805 [Deltaproteobacteria bacterium HGW-Deltaproteobacteria-17]|nr:MAG: hypothetical protein CVU59_13805 [Deltaproteobacteria bacterium HGW-Deltaproteobacteria-17]
MVCEHVHYPTGEEVRSIAGYYTILEEDVLHLDGRELLYLVEIAHIETSCCGAGGVGFILVPGYIVSRHESHNSDGLPVSRVERVVDPAERELISGLLKRKYPHFHQISFA